MCGLSIHAPLAHEGRHRYVSMPGMVVYVKVHIYMYELKMCGSHVCENTCVTIKRDVYVCVCAQVCQHTRVQRVCVYVREHVCVCVRVFV